jgi:thymidylate synthase
MVMMRSSDFLVASDINKIQAIALQHMVAKSCGYKPGKFTHAVDNLHIYDNQYDAAYELMKRYVKSNDIGDVDNPKLILHGDKDFYDWTIDDFEIVGYAPMQPQIKFELAV